MNYKKDLILSWVLSWQNCSSFCQSLRPPCVDNILNRNYNISLSNTTSSLLPPSSLQRETERQSQTNLYLLRVAQCWAPLFEGDFVTTLHFIASNDQPRRQHWITSLPSCLSLTTVWRLTEDSLKTTNWPNIFLIWISPDLMGGMCDIW